MRSKLSYIIRYDMVCGFRYNYTKYIIALVFVLLNCALFSIFSSWTIHSGFEYRCTLMDCFIYFFKGARMVNLESGSFDIPVIFLGLQIIIASMVGYYPFDDIYGYGKQVFIRVDKKRRWWISKCAWVFATVFMTYLLIYLSIAVYCLFAGVRMDMSYSSELIMGMDGMFIDFIPIHNMILYVFVMPLLYSLMISYVQVMLSMIIGPIISFLLVMIYDIVGILVTHQLLFANYSMIYRDMSVTGVDIQPVYGAIFMLIVMLLSIIAGGFVINKKEIFEK